MKIGYMPGVKTWYNNKMFVDIDNADNRKGPFIDLKRKLSSESILIKTLDDPAESLDYLIIHRIDVNLRLLFKYLFYNRGTRLIYIVTEEPAIVSFHKPNLIKYFNFDFVLIYDTNNIPNFYQFQYPNPKLVYSCVTGFDRRHLLCAIVRLRKSNPFIKNSLYKKRNDYIKSLLKFNQFHLFGGGWDFQEVNYFGEIESKSQALSNYRFALVIENSITQNFLTEKILDCMAQGTVPVYYGCKNVSLYVPQQCFINLDIFLESSEQLVEYLESISEAQWNEYNRNIQLFLNSKDYSDLTSEGYIEILLNIISLNKTAVSHYPIPLLLRSIYVLLLSPLHLLNKSGLKMLFDIIIYPIYFIFSLNFVKRKNRSNGLFV